LARICGRSTDESVWCLRGALTGARFCFVSFSQFVVISALFHTMPAISRLVRPWAAFSSLAVATVAGYFNDTSVCADPKGTQNCYDKAETSYTNCITSNCSGGSKSCFDSCNGDPTCMAKQCPNLGVDCINACGCVKATDQIDCTASSCWNQVALAIYSRHEIKSHSFLPR
jgi:hypothetical protein